ncbi:MAG: tail fiber domain-containing protein [Bacteroidetes bacterium]|nr:tail fiber domain-containing protein [Bacteroidota bacterium]
MKQTKNKSILFAMLIAGAMVVQNVQAQTALSGTAAASNSCGTTAGTGGTDNTNVGCGAGDAIAAGGINNVAVGMDALGALTTGDYNTAIGWQAGLICTTGTYNAFITARAGEANITGSNNCFAGYEAGFNSTVSDNTFLGFQSGLVNSTGANNTCVGSGSAYHNNTGSNNAIVGYQAGYLSGSTSTAISNNCFFGYQAGLGVSGNSNSDNCFFGYQAGAGITTGVGNVLIGREAGSGLTNTGGVPGPVPNTIVGYRAGNGITTSPGNVIMGASSGQGVTTNSGGYNTIVGYNSGNIITTNGYNTCIGNGADIPSTYTNCTFLGNNGGTNWIAANNEMQLGNSNITAIHVAPAALTYHGSDRRIKNNIKENVPGLSFINLLKPVTYHYDIHKESSITGYPMKTVVDVEAVTVTDSSSGNVTTTPAQTHQEIDTAYWNGKYDAEKILLTGLIAQQVDSAAQQIGYDFDGIYKPKDANHIYGLSYTQFVIPLIKAVQELSKTVDSLKAAKSGQRLGDDGSGKNIQNIKLTLPNAATLGDAQPNPNSGSTQIPYYLPDNTNGAKIIFTDMLGKVMKEEVLKAGYGLLNIDTQDLPTGIYNYSLVVDGKVIDNKKMMRNK